ncbi:GNAT family N-acetyltransferase [Ruminococcaceae bacterium OttesenSCG-928-L11]|nr:GNAT family N-acetyltransferase [Ruminococcaceae bacterium OttesenSCG-928-L11]
MEHLGTQILETERLLLRPFVLEDAPAMFKNWAGDPEVTTYLMWPTHTDEGVSRAVLEDWVSQYADKAYYQWAVTLKSNGGEPIGSMSVVKRDDRVEMAHIGYCIGRPWWRQGITSEALAAVMAYLFEEVGVNRIEARHDPRNPGSGKVMVKCGMRCEGTMRQADWNNQGICDTVFYAILREDYQTEQKQQK